MPQMFLRNKTSDTNLQVKTYSSQNGSGLGITIIPISECRFCSRSTYRARNPGLTEEKFFDPTTGFHWTLHPFSSIFREKCRKTRGKYFIEKETSTIDWSHHFFYIRSSETFTNSLIINTVYFKRKDHNPSF